ncbi:hypothetical protein BV22DRAFT_1005190 [Leucogyrophana mollusca]|uniref:Uncharacterized protein n=1 Tax=Leucogyrophana mollusca TaxID=85980 RepID=A0ACB8BQL7_9AGAM|nr:hypothetical protein BV22DRAFT_1005190 [Leucogyrophana mollusca]
MPARYAPLPNRHSTQDTELDEAFEESDNEDDEQRQLESTPLTQSYEGHSDTPKSAPAGVIPGTYDFERDYDYDRPPPGSPPSLTAVAVPNDIGNSNGQLPSSPLGTTVPRPSFFRRAVGAVGAILPTHYARIPTSEPGRSNVRGGGIENDGVFANVMAKPTRPVQVRTEDGSLYMVPEETQSTAPPSYAAAQADAVPPYWETTVHAPSGLDSDSGMIIEDLPSGSILAFIANLFTSFFFQFIGFLLTYLLHTTHAAKYGSRAGLGLTLIQYGFYSRASIDEAGNAIGGDQPLGWPSEDPPLMSTSPTAPVPQDNAALNITSREWLSFLLMTLGWFLLLSSLIGFWRVKHWESAIRASHARGPPTPEEIEHDILIRRNIEQVFGIRDEGGPAAAPPPPSRGRSHATAIVIPGQRELEEARLTEDLRAAGLL